MGVLKNIFSLSLFQDNREILDLSAFGNEIAFKTSWEPLVGGGTNFCTHRAQKNASLMGDVIVFKTAIQAYLFALCFVALGAVFAIASAAGEIADMPVWPGLGVLAFGCWYLWSLRQKESRFNRYSSELTQGKKSFDLKNAEAIQLIREYVRGSESSYYSYELNLICSDGSRINIIDHGALRKLREDAALLAEYLSIPVWDAIDFRLPDVQGPFDGKAEVLRQNIG
jgi:hypothetical protein